MASVHPSLKCGPGVLIGEEVTIEENCTIGAYSIISGDTHIGPGNTIDPHVVIGAEPQDLKFQGGGKLRIGADNRFREFATVHVGHLSEKGTVIGDANYFLVGTHVGHDCVVGNHNFMTNHSGLAGHVEVGDYVNFSAYVGIHQFCRVGSYSMVGGHSSVKRDIYPYSIIHGDPAWHIGVNSIGLKRSGFSVEDTVSIREAFRLMRNQKAESDSDNRFLKELMNFKSQSDRGMCGFYRKRS